MGAGHGRSACDVKWSPKRTPIRVRAVLPNPPPPPAYGPVCVCVCVCVCVYEGIERKMWGELCMIDSIAKMTSCCHYYSHGVPLLFPMNDLIVLSFTSVGHCGHNAAIRRATKGSLWSL